MTQPTYKRQSPEAEALLAQPAFNSIFSDVSDRLSQLEFKDYRDYEWWFVASQSRAFPFQKHTFVATVWEEVEKVISGEQKLYYFLERPSGGLVGNSPKFWLFFSGTTANEYFRRQETKPADFKKEEIKSLPTINMTMILQKNLMSILAQEDEGLFEKKNQVFNLVKMSGERLDLDASKEFKKLARQLLAAMAAGESAKINAALTKGEKVLALKKTLKVIHEICYRYFIKHNDVERDYLEKILSDDQEEQLKGLKMALEKLKPYLSS